MEAVNSLNDEWICIALLNALVPSNVTGRAGGRGRGRAAADAAGARPARTAAPASTPAPCRNWRRGREGEWSWHTSGLTWDQERERSVDVQLCTRVHRHHGAMPGTLQLVTVST